MHVKLTIAWKKPEPFRNIIIQTRLLPRMRPLLEAVLGYKNIVDVTIALMNKGVPNVH